MRRKDEKQWKINEEGIESFLWSLKQK